MGLFLTLRLSPTPSPLCTGARGILSSGSWSCPSLLRILCCLGQTQSPSCGPEWALRRESRGSPWPSQARPELTDRESLLSRALPSELTGVLALSWGMCKFGLQSKMDQWGWVLETRGASPTLCPQPRPPHQSCMHRTLLLPPAPSLLHFPFKSKPQGPTPMGQREGFTPTL